jgi:hypothetical protein
MAGIPVPPYQQFWTDRTSSLKTESSKIIETHPDAAAPMRQLFKVLCEIEDLASHTPTSVGERAMGCKSYCNALCGKTLFSALYGEVKNVLQASSQASRKSKAENDTPRERQPALPRKPL